MNGQQIRKVWITGAGGLIGNYVVQVLREIAPGITSVPLTRAKLDLLDFKAVAEAFNSENPDLIVHCAAMSRSPDCETNPLLARKANVEVTKHLCNLAHDRRLVFFSSDQVFDGRNAPYKETAVPNPLSVYAETKARAEDEVLGNGRHLVVRTSLNGGTSPTCDRGFNEQLRNVCEQGKEAILFTDEFRSPIHARHTAAAVCELALRGCTGIFHVAGLERLSRWELGQIVAKRWPGLNPRIKPGSLRDYKGSPRAPDLTMDCSKAMSVLWNPLQGLSDWLMKHPEEVF